jgi:tRNA A37 threonylcarbamoyladenosine synthetase subunit TsaC/SUA5/YrdC
MSERLLQPGVVVTNLPHIAADHIRQGKTIVLPFAETPNGMYAWFAADHQEGRHELARLKGREKNKPFVHTSDVDHRDGLLDHPHLSPEISDNVKERVSELLKIGSADRPIGVLLPAEGEFGEFNVTSISVDGKLIHTVGLMVSGPSRVYSEVVQELDGDALAGSSANQGGRVEANGSGHHNVLELVKDFRQFIDKDSTVVVVVPFDNEHQSKTGPSTTSVYIDAFGNGRLVREGSLPAEEMIKLMEQAGIPYVGKIDAYKQIKPYAYPDTLSNDARNEKERGFIKMVNAQGTIHIPHTKS